uniref:Uncharacterized protein n=1 Tax=viral metagenome TaxID=1070528 RepID=A0A6C0ERA0_9ZZZZ
MSLAMYAAPFNDNSNNNDEADNNFINKKKQTHNKTQKRIPKENFDTDKVNSVLENIHNNLKPDDSDDHNHLGDFNPPPMPQSSGVTRTNDTTEHMSNMTNNNNQIMFRTLGRAPQPNYDSNTDLDLNNFTTNYGDHNTNEQYYKKILPGYKTNPNTSANNKPYYNVNYNNSTESPSQDILLQKLNYMINLLEDQQDEKTNNVTEEVVLYSFLGIFIIFVVDSFARVGKYVR